MFNNYCYKQWWKCTRVNRTEASGWMLLSGAELSPHYNKRPLTALIVHCTWPWPPCTRCLLLEKSQLFHSFVSFFQYNMKCFKKYSASFYILTVFQLFFKNCSYFDSWFIFVPVFNWFWASVQTHQHISLQKSSNEQWQRYSIRVTLQDIKYFFPVS